MIEMDLTGKVAVVTGAGRGIGRGIALRLARAGSTVVCADLDEASAAETASLSSGADAYAAQLDVTSVSDVDRVLSEVIARNGRLDILVNNAGINRDAMLHKMTDDQWQQVINVDLTGVFNMMRATSVLMRQAASGRIVNISSASWMGNIGQANYSAAKAGVVGLTRTAARELARYQVTVNAICPGFIDTDMTRGIPDRIRDEQVAKIPPGGLVSLPMLPTWSRSSPRTRRRTLRARRSMSAAVTRRDRSDSVFAQQLADSRSGYFTQLAASAKECTSA